MPEKQLIETLREISFKISLAQSFLLKGENLVSWDMLEESKTIIMDTKHIIEENNAGLL